LSDELIDELLADTRTEGEIAGRGGLFGHLTTRLLERAMEVELTDHGVGSHCTSWVTG
jgi:putative transposase